MGKVTTLGIDLAKKAFQLHGMDRSGHVVTSGGSASAVDENHYAIEAVSDRHRGMRQRALLGTAVCRARSSNQDRGNLGLSR